METSNLTSGQTSRDQVQINEELRHTNRQLAAALEENLRLQSDKLYLASIVESSNDAIIGVDLKGVVTAWNEAAARMFAYRPDEILARPVAALFPAAIGDTEAQLMLRAAHGETLTRYRTQRVRKDGAVLDVSITISPIRNAAGVVIGASMIVEDVTEQLLRERKMRRLEAHRDYLADLVESSNDAIIAGTVDGRIASWNKAAETMFGYTAREVVGLPLSVLAPAERRRDVEEVFRRLMEGERAIRCEIPLLKKGGASMLIAMTASLVFNNVLEIRGTSASMRDITEQRAAEERLKNLQAELIHLSRWNTMGMMASTLAHELNQPLTAAVNYVRAARRLLDGTAPDIGRVGEFLDRAVGETKLAGGIIRSLRDFIDKRETARAVQDINKVVEEALSLGVAGAPESGIEVQLAPSLPPVFIDKIQIEQVLLNLIRNGLDAMGDQANRKLVVQTAADGRGFVCVSVTDNGPGIAPEIVGQLFQPFVTTKEKGMGVGLPICQSIVEGHGGRIWAEEVKPSGTAFRFQLPVEEIKTNG